MAYIPLDQSQAADRMASFSFAFTTVWSDEGKWLLASTRPNKMIQNVVRWDIDAKMTWLQCKVTTQMKPSGNWHLGVALDEKAFVRISNTARDFAGSGYESKPRILKIRFCSCLSQIDSNRMKSLLVLIPIKIYGWETLKLWPTLACGLHVVQYHWDGVIATLHWRNLCLP